MPHKRIPPAPEWMMNDERHSGHFTICCRLREIYQASTDEDVRYKCREAMAMAKKMNDRLQYYKNKTVEAEEDKVVSELFTDP